MVDVKLSQVEAINVDVDRGSAVHWQAWAKEEDERLIQGLEAKESIARLAADLNRSRAAVEGRARKFGYSGLDMRSQPWRSRRTNKSVESTS